MHAVGGVGGADIDVDDNALAAAGDQRVAGRHMRRRIFVRTAHHGRHGLAEFTAMRHFLDDRRMIGAEVAKQIIDPDLLQPFEQVIGRGIVADIGLPGD